MPWQVIHTISLGEKPTITSDLSPQGSFWGPAVCCILEHTLQSESQLAILCQPFHSERECLVLLLSILEVRYNILGVFLWPIYYVTHNTSGSEWCSEQERAHQLVQAAMQTSLRWWCYKCLCQIRVQSVVQAATDRTVKTHASRIQIRPGSFLQITIPLFHKELQAF